MGTSKRKRARAKAIKKAQNEWRNTSVSISKGMPAPDKILDKAKQK